MTDNPPAEDVEQKIKALKEPSEQPDTFIKGYFHDETVRRNLCRCDNGMGAHDAECPAGRGE